MPAAKGEVLVVGPAEVQLLRLGELGGVAVGRAEQEGHKRTGRKGLALVGDVL
jgi:hypothetical protein